MPLCYFGIEELISKNVAAVLTARSPVLSDMIKEADKNSNGTVPILDLSQYSPKQVYAILTYIYTYRLLSSSLDGEELRNFVKLYNINYLLALVTLIGRKYLKYSEFAQRIALCATISRP